MVARSDGASRGQGGRRAAPVLDIAALRAGLDAGRLVRVSIVPSGSFPDGATGRVRSIGNPETDGDEYLQIEIGSGRNRDVLPFAPGDLAPYRRSGLPAPSVAPGMDKTDRPRRPAVQARTRPSDRGLRPAVRTGRPSGEPALLPGRSDAGETEPVELFPPLEPVKPLTPRVPGDLTGADAPVKRTSGRAKGKRPAVTITVSTDGEAGWRLEARVGSRVVIRAAPVSPARVAEIARELDEPRLVEVVDGLLAEHRKAVQVRADQLAAELAEVQAELELFPPS